MESSIAKNFVPSDPVAEALAVKVAAVAVVVAVKAADVEALVVEVEWVAPMRW